MMQGSTSSNKHDTISHNRCSILVIICSNIFLNTSFSNNIKESEMHGKDWSYVEYLETDNETTFVARQQIFNKQVYAAVAG
jgi:hypothetical protein